MSGYTDFTDEEKPTILVRDPKIKPKGSWQSLFIGKPLPTADAPHQTIGKFVGLAVFAADALSSSAYGTQEVLVILAALGSAAYQYVFPISLAIIILLAIVTLSYEQTIHAYPNGGGSYIVARDNLGSAAAKVAAASLLTDYVLTVAVSMSSGVANLVSAIPSLFDYRVWITVALVVFVMLMNLRGIKESGMAFAFPAYFFIATMLLTIGVGLYRYFAGSLGQVVDPPPVIHTPENVGALAFLILRAFSSGTSALTGVEAVSNGIPAFKEPKTKNAGQTLIMMSSILAILTLGISYLASHIHAIASEEETVISQIARTAFDGRGLTYLLVVASTTVILILAANTSFADFPRLSAITAVDGLLPRQLAYRGSR
ncbi:MAG TPA: APC family permease, partial [Bellilinea sp.]|nr:APC family permease [Bellilinea sp.]